MRLHEHDGETDSGLRPRSDRVDSGPDHLALRAAASGRTDALGPGGLLELQRSVGNAGVGAMLGGSPVHGVVGSGGEPLDAETRADMEGRLGHDFTGVRVHTDAAADASARAMNAQAYTVGSDVVFQRDRYDPHSADGRLMLAHELTHVVQQRSGPVDGTDAGGGVRVSDPSDRFERAAVANAAQVMSMPAPVQRSADQRAGGDPGSGAASVQRDEAAPFVQRDETAPFVQREEAAQEDEEAAAQTFVQRQEEEPKEEPES